ncbi:DUF6939 family protein [Aureivirga marina]|uniref:DUF6939 family protein n=1 Tax=Aureivirga marina TaxID=1182451 RepID=UPI0018CB9AD2|nr:hypothetical protein [Aureivirga marina]
MIFIISKRRKLDNIRKEFPNAEIIDVTSKASLPYLKFSPFYPIKNIPVPFSKGYFSASVEGIWQGLKVFENHPIDMQKFENQKMKSLKRTVRKFGKTIGHQKGINSEELLDYISARKEIYIPTYTWILENKLQKEIKLLQNLHKEKDLVFLDYDVNEDVNNTIKPLSHASILKKYLLNNN